MMKRLLSSPKWVITEFIILCLALPTLIITYRFGPFMFFFLWGAAAYCGAQATDGIWVIRAEKADFRPVILEPNNQLGLINILGNRLGIML